MTLFADVVAASSEVGETSSRSRKVEILAELLRRLDADEVPIVVGFLSGVPRQGRIGVGYSIAYAIGQASARKPSVTVGELDQAISQIQETTGPGSA